MRGGLRLKSNLGKQGFSIIEVLIVLAVTAGLFLSAVIMLSGKQRQTDFSTALREVQTQVQQIISEVNTGFYPSQENFRCTGSLTGPTITTAGVTQGENVGCIFLGKVIQFGVGGTADPEEFGTFSVAGLQRIDGIVANEEVQTLAQARPSVIAESAANPSAPSGSVQRKPLRGGLTVLWVRNGDNAAVNLGAVGFISSLASYSGGQIVSGSQSVNLMPVGGTSVGMSQLDMANAINTNLSASAVNPNGGVQVCFRSGGTNQSGLMTIGSNGRQLSVKMEVRENTSCS